MPESKTRKAAETKAVSKRKAEEAAARADKERQKAMAETGRWVVPTMVTLGILGVLWLVVYYIASAYLPFMAQLGPWNMGIGMGLMALAFVVATQWK